MRGRIIRKPRHPTIIDNEDSILGNLRFSLKNWSQAHTVEGGFFAGLDLAKIQQGGKDVLNLGQATDVARLSKPAFGPTDKAGHAVSTLPDLSFLAPHPGIEILGPK